MPYAPCVLMEIGQFRGRRSQRIHDPSTSLCGACAVNDEAQDIDRQALMMGGGRFVLGNELDGVRMWHVA
jgi:hypothetical protein